MATTWPVRGSANMFSGPLHTVAIMNSVRPSGPQRASEAPVVKLDRLQDLAAFADAYTALVGDVAVPDNAGGVVASGTPSPSSAQTRRLESPPSAAISKAVSRFAYDSATISVRLSAVTSMPLGKASPSAT